MKSISLKGVLFTALAIALLLTVVLSVAAGKNGGMILDSDEKRREYIAGLEISLSQEPAVVRNIIIPSQFSDVYSRYNDLQKQAGFDLWSYRGEYAVQYSYKATGFENDTVKVNLILYKDKLIGGDISSTRLDGFMTGLVPKSN